jgi:protein LTV1
MHTNTENHPAVIRSRTIQQFKTGAAAATIIPPATSSRRRDEEEETDSGSETEVESSKVTVARPKGETTEERRTRKAGVKAERSVCLQQPFISLANSSHQARRTEKKSHRAAFTDERKRQLASHRKMVGNGQAADLSSQGRGVLSLS